MKRHFPNLGQRSIRLLSVLAVLFAITACETPHVPGLSLGFPDSAPAFVSSRRTSDDLSIAPSIDRRSEYIGRDVAGTGWLACKADTLNSGQLPKLVDERINEAISAAKIFSDVKTPDVKTKWTLSPEIQVFCSQTRGFIGRRVAGLVTIKFSLQREGVAVWEQAIEQVVTDADSEYTGSFVTTVEQAMRRSMADSLRVVLKRALGEIDKAASKS